MLKNLDISELPPNFAPVFILKMNYAGFQDR